MRRDITPFQFPVAVTAAHPLADAALPQQLRDLALQSLDDDKAEDVVVIDLAGKSSIADYMIIASGRSTRQVGSMADKLRDRLKQAGAADVQIEGMPQCDWVLLDAGDVIVHIFRPEVRSFYNIEKMWGVLPPRSDSGMTPPEADSDVYLLA